MSTIEFNEALMDIENNLKSFALGFTRNMEDAKDLTQDTMLKAINYKSYYTPQTNFKAWVFTIMRNIFINQYRRKVKSGTIFDNSKELYLITNSKGHEQTPVSQIATKDIEEKIESLSSEYKEPFVLHFKGFKYKEIAERLQISTKAVEKRMHLALKQLKEKLEN